MKQTFNDKKLEQKFNQNGYILIDGPKNINFSKIVRDLNSLHPSDHYKGNQKTKIGSQTFHVTFFDSEKKYKEEIYNYVQILFLDFVKQVFTNHKCSQANVFLKLPKTGFVHPHQNLTIVNEKKFKSVSCWMPLQDTNLENGTLCLIPSSHLHFEKYRNSHIYWPYIDFFRNGEGRHYFKPINVRAGQVLIIDDRLVHFTPENKSKIDRWVLHSIWTSKDAQLKFYDVQGDVVNEYNVNDTFWQFTQPKEFPSSIQLVKSFAKKCKLLTNEELVSLLKILQKKA
jgi:hypothetical protein